MYEVTVVGAGPCGLACSIELGKRGKKVALIESGKDYSYRNCKVDFGGKCNSCNPCNVISGIGGCIHYGDSVKLSYYPSGRRLFEKLGEEEYNKLLERACYYWGIDKEKSFYHPNLEGNKGFEIKNYPVCVMDSASVKTFIETMKNAIDRMDNVEVMVETSVDAVKKKNDYFEIALNGGRVISSKKVVLAVGRGGLFWLKNTIKDMGVTYFKPESSMGVRFEFPKHYLVELGSAHPDLKVRTTLNGKKYKTFCFCAGENGGRIKLMNFGDFTLLDGHVLTGQDVDFGRGNFALLTKFVQPVEYSCENNEYLKKYLEAYLELNGLNKGQPICQSFSNFQNCVDEEPRKYDGTSSVTELTYGSVFKLFDKQTLKEFCNVANIIFKYIWDNSAYKNRKSYSEFLDEILVVGLEMEGLWDRVETTQNFESSCSGLYFGGDCGGETQGVLQAMLSGIKIATVL